MWVRPEHADFSSLFLSRSSGKLQPPPQGLILLGRETRNAAPAGVGPVPGSIWEFVRLRFVVCLLIDGFEVFVQLVI